jgi:tetratricopeptide (TPR) repeat protein
MTAQRHQAVASLVASRPILLGPAGEGGAGTDGDRHQLAGGPARQEISMARAIRAQCLAAGQPAADIARAIYQHCGPAFGTTLVRAHRLALGIALADVVAQVRARYVSEGRTPPRFSETLLSSYESGQKRPGPEYLHYLCCVYQAEAEDLGYTGPCLCGHRHRAPAAAGPAADPVPGPGPAGPLALDLPPQVLPAPPSVSLRRLPMPDGPGAHLAVPGMARPVPGPPAPGGAPGCRPGLRVAAPPPGGPGPAEADDDVIRRALLRLMADAVAPVGDRFFGAVERIRRRLDDALLGATVSAGMLDHWEDMAAEYGRQYMTVPPLRLVCDVLLDLGDVRRMCGQRQPLEFAERLCRLAARLAALVGMTMIDVGDQRLARAFFSTARAAADETGDRRLRAWVAVRESLVPLYYGDPAQAAGEARASAGLAGQRPCVAGVMAPVVEARALARLGRRRARASWPGPARGGVGGQELRRASAALDRAHDALDALPSEERWCAAFGYTERQLLFHQGDALVTLGDHRGADDAFTAAMRLYSPAEVLDRSLVSLGQARCRLVAGEPEEALRLSRETVLRLPAQHRQGLVLRTARSLGEAVVAACGQVPALRDYQEALVTG